LIRFPPAKRVALLGRRAAGGALPEITLSVHEQGSGPAVVLCHGFPEIAYSWRHQIPALARAGFRAIAPDQRGYGASDAPAAIEEYDLEHLTADLARLLDALRIERAVFCGHDWGGFVAWAMPCLYPERTAGVIGVNTPYIPFPGLATLRAAFPKDEKLYILWFQQPGVAERVLDRNPRLVFEKLMRRGIARERSLRRMVESGGDANPFLRLSEMEPAGPELLAPEELDTFARAFEKSGFRGGINWYRNVERNRARFPEVGTRKLDLPCLMVTAEWDPALPPESAAGMPALCSDLETHMIPACGHWTQQEKPRELNRLMIDWLARRFQ
jgi:pimeloyl-ACP methyl ester carboxylesterase